MIGSPGRSSRRRTPEDRLIGRRPVRPVLKVAYDRPTSKRLRCHGGQWRLQQLDKCVLFKALNEQERRDLAAHAQSRTFAPNEPIDPESS
jgi:hypothetical protein